MVLFAKDPSFCGRECATFWAAEELSDWRAFRIDYAGFKLAAFRTAMKAAHANAQLPANAVRTTQPPSVSLYRQLPEVPPLFSGRLEELAAALRDAMDQVLHRVKPGASFDSPYSQVPINVRVMSVRSHKLFLFHY